MAVDAPSKQEAGVDTFLALDMRVGRVTQVEDFPQARSPSYKLTVDFGPGVGTRRTVAQITNYSREELLGRSVVGAINLGRKRIAGFSSEFLVLGAMQPDGTVLLLSADGDPAPGTPIG